MKFIKNMALMSALSFVIASNAFAITISITRDNFDWKNIKQTQMGAVKKAPVTKAPVKKAPVTKAPVNKVSVPKAPVNKVSVPKAPVNNFFANKTPVKNVSYFKVPYIQAPKIEVPKDEAPDTNYQEAELGPTIAPFSFSYEKDIDSPDLGHSDIGSKDSNNQRISNVEVPTSVPVPAAAWLLGSALIGFVSFSKRRNI